MSEIDQALAPRKPSSEIEQALSGKRPSEIEQALGPVKPEATAGDVAKEVAAAGVEAVGNVPQMGAELLVAGVNKAAGSEVLPAPVNPLGGAAEAIRDTQTAGGQAARGDSFKGDILAPSTWEMPQTGSGFAMGMAQGVGSLASTMLPLGGLKYAGMGEKALVGAGGTLGFLATGGQAAQQVRDEVGKMKPEELQALPAYQTHVAAGMSPEAARSKIANDSALYAGVLSGVFGALQGGFNAKILDDVIAEKGISALLGRIAEKRVTRAGVAGAAGFAGEGIQEGMEQVGQNVGENLARGQPALQDPTRDTFGNVVLGAAVGGPIGAGVGAASHRAAPAPIAPPATSATSATSVTPVGLTAEQEDLAMRRIERQAMQDYGMIRGQKMGEPELDMISAIREELNARRAEQGAGPVTIAEWKPVLDKIAQPAPKLFPFITQNAAQRHAQQLTERFGEPFAVSPHPTVPGRWTAHLAGLDPGAIAGANALGGTNAIATGQEPQGDLGQREGAPAGLQEPGANRNEPSQVGQGGAETGSGDRALEGAGEVGYAGPDRRENAFARRRVADMTAEERAQALLTSDKAGIPNRRAYDEADKRAVQSSIDLDGMKEVNDTMGHAAGDRLIATAGQALREAGLEAYHFSGDEFAAQFDDHESAKAALEGVRDRLAKATVTVQTPDGRTLTHTGIGFSYGLGKDLDTADFALQADKADRKQRGLRAGARDLRGIPEEPARGEHDQGREPAAEVTPASDRTPESNALAVSVDEAAHEAATSPENAKPEPTEAQKAAGNYAKGHTEIAGLPISIENPEGSQRRPEWPTLKAHYGYFRGTKGRDKEHVDVFVKPGTARDFKGRVYVVDQNKADGTFDEHKVMLGYGSADEARAAYLANYTAGWDRVRGVRTFPLEGFKKWVADSSLTAKPATGEAKAPEEKLTAKERREAEAQREAQERFAANKVRLRGTPWETSREFTVKLANGKTVQVEYQSPEDALNGSIGGVHFDFKGPVTETGYRSAFVNNTATDAHASPEEFAQGMAQEMADSLAKTSKKQAGAKSEAEKKKAAATARAQREAAKAAEVEKRRLEAEGFAALRQMRALASVASASPEDFQAKATALAAQWASEDETRKAFVLTDKMIPALRREAAKMAREIAGEEKEKPKLRNTGEDLRRSWELVKAKLKAKNDAEGITGMNRIFASTTRADLFAGVEGEGATPGTRRYVEQLRDATRTFKEWAVEKGPLSALQGTRWRASPGDKIESFVRGDAYITPSKARDAYRGIISDEALDSPGFTSNQDPTVQDRLTLLANAADEYLRHVRGLIDMRGAVTVAEAAKRFTEAIWTAKDLSGIASWTAMDDAHTTPHGQAMRDTGIIADLRGFIQLHNGSWEVRKLLAQELTTENDQRKQPLTPPRLQTLVRDEALGAVRNGDVTPKQFKDHFGFADIGFGSWVKSGEDQAHLNRAWDAFSDLANFLGVDPKMIGFGGQLHFTLGALGHGSKAAATFHPGHPLSDAEGNVTGTVRAINLTKTKGDGTVAHEWFHALDHFLSTTEAGRQAMKSLVDGLKVRYDAETLKSAALAGLRKQRWMQSAKSAPPIENATSLVRYYARKTTASSFKREADKMDPHYWGNDHELRARAWEAWVGDSLAGTNNYLVNPGWSGEGMTKPPTYRGTPYPVGEERKSFARWFEALKASLVQGKKGLEVDATKFAETMPKDRDDYQAAAESIIADLPVMYAQMLREDEAKTQEKTIQAAKAAREAEEARREAAAAEAREQAAESPQAPAIAQDAPLGATALEQLFDLAVESTNAQAHENATAPSPGETARFADTQPAAPKITTGEGVSPPGAKDLIAKAASLGVTGIDEALTGLTKLFGGGKIQSFPGGFDEETYKQAKPHFEASLKAFQAAGKTLLDFFKMLIERFGEGVKPYAIRFAQDMKLTAQLGSQPSATLKLAQWVRGQLNRPGAQASISSPALFERANESFGGTQAEGKYTPKDAYDAAEAGVNLYVLENLDRLRRDDDTAAIARVVARHLAEVTQRLPTATKRTGEQEEFQQFSTVPALAYLANWVAHIQPGELMGEPSAGVGGLAVFAQAQGARVIANELSSRRAAILKEVLPQAQVFHENAEQAANVLPEHPTVIVMNPPFSSAAGRMEGARDSMNGARHVESALEWLQPGGRLVAIVGKGMAEGEARFAPWWAKMKERYNVRAILSLNGAEYAKYGTSYDNVLFVIDKTGPTTTTPVVARVEAYNEIPTLLEGIRNDRITHRDDLAPQPGALEPGRGEVPPPGLGEPALAPPAVPGAMGDGERNLPGTRGGGGAALGGRPGAGDAARDGKPGRGSGDRAGATGGDRPGAGRGPDLGLGERPDEHVERDTAGAAKRQTELTDSVFESYQPQKARVKGSQPHPGNLVESAAMAAVEPLDVTYSPHLPRAAIEKGYVSDAQIEAVIYAGQAHQELLPGGERRGFFIGDGTGVGKGREIAAIILDNAQQGRKKALWVSAASGLIEDAKRDYGGVTGRPGTAVKDIFALRNVAEGGAGPAGKVSRGEGIMFLTYDTLKGGEKAQAGAAPGTSPMTSLKQIVDWVGPEFDGVIAFDESHKIKNLGGQKGGVVAGSQRAIVAAELSKQLPKARVIYVSATGATEVANLAYASRLGLWGPGTAFSDAQDFTGKIGAAGLASMELVARDMKAMGAYIARSLSYDGVEQTQIDASFTPLQKEIYDDLAKAWQVVLRNVNEALVTTGQAKNGRAKGAARSAFWASQQRFFNQVITAMMTPAVLDQAKKELADGKAIVFQLVNTNEASQERQVESAEANDTPLEELDFTPKQMLIEYLKKSFPVAQFETFTDENGKVGSRPVLDSQGAPVTNKKLEAERDALIEHIDKNLRVPDNPIDLLYEAFGEKDVAEVSGRGRRFQKVIGRDGSFTLEERKRTGKSNQVDARAFMDGKKRVLVFTDAGGTGFSFHSDKGEKNQRRRFHVLLQPGWVAENAMQGLGRTHRSNEVNQPLVGLPRSDLKAQKRFISSIARRLDQLGALTRGQRNAASQGIFTNRDNLESKYAVAALRQLMEDMAPGGKVVEDAHELIAAMGLDELYDPLTSKIVERAMPTIQRFLNRLLSLTTSQQDRLFTEFEVRMDSAIDAAIANGTYDDGMQTLKALKVDKTRDEVVHTDPRSGADTRYLELALTQATTLNTWERLQEELATFPDDRPVTYYFDTQAKRPFAIVSSGERMGANGQREYRGYRFDVRSPSMRSRGHFIQNRDVYERGGEARKVMRDAEGNLVRPEGGYSPEGTNIQRFEKIGVDQAQYLWREAFEAAPKTETETKHMLTGALLPIWDRIESEADSRSKSVVRTQTDDGERLIGRIIPEEERAEILKRLGVGAIRQDLPAKDIIAQIMGGKVAELANRWMVKKVRVAKEARLEIIASYLSPADLRALEAQGAIVEKIGWQNRVFIPVNDEAFNRLTRDANRPVVDLVKDGKDDTQFSAAQPQERRPRARGIPLKQLREALERQLGKSLPEDAFVARPLPDDLAPALDVVAKAFGVRIVPFVNNEADQVAFNGVHVGDGTLYVDVNAEYPLLMVVGHELTHEMQKRAPELYAQLRDRVVPLLKNREQYREERLSVLNRDIANPALEAEMIADTVGQNFTQPAFWREVVKREPGLAQRLVDWILHFIRRTVNILRGNFRAERFVSDLEKARQAIADAMVAFAKVPAATSPETLEFSAAGPWYSELERQVIASKTESAPAAQWKATIQGMKGVKAEELAWSGLLDWLDAREGKVSKWEIQQFLQSQGVRVEETLLGETEAHDISRRDTLVVDLDAAGYSVDVDMDDEITGITRRADGMQFDWVNEGFAGQRGFFGAEGEAPPHTVQTAALELYDLAPGTGENEVRSSTRYSGYTLPGGQNYRELLLTLPTQQGAVSQRAIADIDRQLQRKGMAPMDAAQRAILGRLGNEALDMIDDFESRLGVDVREARAELSGAQDVANIFRSSHFDQPNILAHVRFDERRDADGKRVLFIEEIQSDWAQKGKREGFIQIPQRPTDRTALPPGVMIEKRHVEIINETFYDPVWTPESGRRGSAGQAGKTIQEAVDNAWENAVYEAKYGKVPAAPFVGKTEAWVALAVKRTIRYASENGFDRVAFTTGEQQAERYDLSKYIESVGYEKRGNLYNIAAFGKRSDAVWRNDHATLQDVEDHLGKEIARKVEAGEGEAGGSLRYLRGLDLKVGGEGMKTFYDRIVPNVVNDVLKKLGGERVTEVTIPHTVFEVGMKEPETDRLKQPGFDITPAMKERALAGLPLFSVATGIREKSAFFVNDLVRSTKQFNWWDKTVGTQLHKATKNPWFRRVFEQGQDYLHDVSEFATRAMNEAPNVLLKLEKLADIAKLGAKPEELKAIGNAIFEETLSNKLFTEQELRERGFTDRSLGFYNEVRRAINRSLDDLAASEWVKKTRGMGLEEAHRAVKANLEDAQGILLRAIDGRLGELRLRYAELIGDPAMEGARNAITTAAAGYKQVRQEIVDSAERVEKMKSQGYAPLMRFGRYTVHAWHESETGGQVSDFFGMYENERSANAARRAIAEEFPDSTVDQGIMSQEGWKLFQGVSPDTLEVFARALGVDESPVFQEYLKLAVNNRSALKRLIHRKGVAGFSEDTTRVLAAFVTSNARRASGNWHFADMLAAVAGIPRNEGDVKDEAVRLVEYLQNPQEEAVGFRSFLFAQFLGGSAASAMVNMTQPLLMTFPYLAQYGGKAATMLRAARVAMGKPVAGSPLAVAMDKASQDGIIAPQEIHQLYAETIRSFGSNIWVRRFMRAWGSLFAVSEAFNRRLTFAAAYETAQAKQFEDPYSFAVRAVEETQGIYNRGNRPNFARGTVGATIFTFKQFSVAYLEFLARLPKKEKALALAFLVVAAGVQGLPFADDLDDLLDTVGQSLGYNTNSKRWKRKLLAETLGPVGANFVLQGFSALPGIPLDVQARLSLGNLIPGSAILKRSEEDKSRDVLEFLGPAGSVAQSAGQAFTKLQQGDLAGAAATVLPTAIQNALKAEEMSKFGFYRDTKGRKVIDTDQYDAFIKAAGFQPSSVAQESRRTQEVRQSIAMVKATESDIAQQWALGIFEHDPGKIDQARAQLMDWNQKNSETPIRIVPQQVMRRVQEMMKTREQRTVKSAPKEERVYAATELQR